MSSVQEQLGKRSRAARVSRILVLPIIVILVICAIAFGYGYIKTTPRYSLYMLKKAIVARDAVAAMKYVDSDLVIDNFAKAYLAADEAIKEEQGDRGFIRRNVIKRVVVQNLPAIKRQLREQPQVLLSVFITDDTVSKMNTLSVIAFKISTKGDRAFVDVRGTDKVSLEMVRTDQSHWKVVAVNMKELPFLKE